MKKKDYSEFQESAELLKNLLRQKVNGTAAPEGAAVQKDAEQTLFDFAIHPDEFATILPSAQDTATILSVTKEKRLEKLLETMCKQGGFFSAILADNQGFPFSAYNSPVEVDALAAFTPYMSQALDEAGRLFERQGADHISIDIDRSDKIVLRRFIVRNFQFFLLVICPQNLDERKEIDLSLEQIKVAVL